MRDQYINSGQGFVIVYSVTCRESFDAIPELRNKILQVKDADEFPMILVGNKCDLEKHREVPKEKGETLAKQWEIPFLESSAKSKINVDEIFHTIVKDIRKVDQATPEPVEVVDTEKGKVVKKRSGCVLL
jgi:small GTP-binding protein